MTLKNTFCSFSILYFSLWIHYTYEDYRHYKSQDIVVCLSSTKAQRSDEVRKTDICAKQPVCF